MSWREDAVDASESSPLLLDPNKDVEVAVLMRRGRDHDSHVRDDHDSERRGSAAARRARAVALGCLYGNAAFQSFSSSGIQAVLNMYLNEFLVLTSASSNALSAAFVVAFSLLAPVGGYIADRRWGNYRTQLVAQIVWAIGMTVIVLITWRVCYTLFGSATAAGTRTIAGVGLFLVAVGYGVVQPLQSVLVADQFGGEEHDGEEDSARACDGAVEGDGDGGAVMTADMTAEEKAKRSSFSWYYFSCNVGNLGGESVNPQLRQDKGPLVAMLSIGGGLVASVIFFVAGRRFLVRKSPPSPQGRAGVQHPEEDHATAKVSMKQKFRSWRETEDGRALMRVVMLFCGMIVFWATFNQQNNSWVQQGKDMDGKICFSSDSCVTIAPDTMPSTNDFMDLLLIVFFEYVAFPLYERCRGYRPRPLEKMTVGLWCAGIAFLLSSILQQKIDHAKSNQEAHLSILWQLPQVGILAPPASLHPRPL